MKISPPVLLFLTATRCCRGFVLPSPLTRPQIIVAINSAIMQQQSSAIGVSWPAAGTLGAPLRCERHTLHMLATKGKSQAASDQPHAISCRPPADSRQSRCNTHHHHQTLCDLRTGCRVCANEPPRVHPKRSRFRTGSRRGVRRCQCPHPRAHTHAFTLSRSSS